MMRSYIVIFLISLGMACFATAQEMNTVWVWLRSQDMELTETFLTQFESAAQEMGLSLQMVASADEIPVQASAVELSIFSTQDDIHFVAVQTLYSQLQLPSPDLYRTAPHPPLLTPFPDGLAVALLHLLYAVGDCETVREQATSFFKGNCLLASGDYAAAVTAFEQDLQSPESMFNLAWAYLQIEQPDKATTIMTDALRQASSDTLVRLLADRAKIYALSFQFEAAIQDITTAIETAETFGEPDKIIARLYKQRGDHIFLIYEWDRVLQDYNRAIKLNPDYANAYYARGVLYYTQGPRTSALADFQTFTMLAPNSPMITEVQTYIESIETELEALGGDDTGPFGSHD